ncbi:MAG: LysM peptidoglycan-binding domain-containing protein [Betaproteobacteria bacterium]
MRKYITTLVFVLTLGGWQGVYAQAPKSPLALKPDAPDRYVVVPGDTLWSIAGRYTDSPWRWNELWNLNKDDIKNPHRIYPGNVIVLDRARGQVAVSNTVQLNPRVRAESTAKAAIPSIPPAAIEPFLTRPLVIEADGLDKAPTIVATEGGRVVIGAGNRAFVKGGGDGNDGGWFVYRRGKALVDPDSKSTLGYEAIYLGTARTVVAGDPATIELTSTTQEVSAGDKLVAAGKPVPVTYAPRAPTAKISGRVIGTYGGVGQVGEAGRHSIITLSVGRSQGVEPGHVLALYRLGATVADASTNVRGAPPVKLPDERYGLVFVFRSFDRVSYALVMDVSRPVNPLDVVQNP